MVQPKVSLLFLSAFFYCVTCLTDVDGSTFIWDLVDSKNFKTKAVLDQPENAMRLGQREMYCFYAVLSQYAANMVG
jgi:hypothetical protein